MLALVWALREEGHKVVKHNILLGVGGTVYRDTLDTLPRLGVAKQQAVATLEKLHLYAVRQVQVALRVRRRMEAQVEGRRRTGKSSAGDIGRRAGARKGATQGGGEGKGRRVGVG